MRHDVVSVAVPSSAGTGAARDARNYEQACVVVLNDSASAFNIDIEGKFSGDGNLANDVWFTLAASVTGSAIIPLADETTGAPIPYTHVRVKATTVGANLPKVLLAGRHSRTDH